MQDERPEYLTRQLTWEHKTPWFRRISARTGLQGKLVLSFMFLLVVTLGASSLQFVSESRQMTEEVLGSKATTIASTVGIASEASLEHSDCAALAGLGTRVLANKDI